MKIQVSKSVGGGKKLPMLSISVDEKDAAALAAARAKAAAYVAEHEAADSQPASYNMSLDEVK